MVPRPRSDTESKSVMVPVSSGMSLQHDDDQPRLRGARVHHRLVRMTGKCAPDDALSALGEAAVNTETSCLIYGHLDLAFIRRTSSRVGGSRCPTPWYALDVATVSAATHQNAASR